MGRMDAKNSAMKMAFRARPLALTIFLLVAARALVAHVGSPDVYYEGDAGPYHLFVTVRMPQVIPGVAEIQVRCESDGARTIQVVPLRLTGPGSSLPPTPDLAETSKDDPQFFTSSLWLGCSENHSNRRDAGRNLCARIMSRLLQS